MVEKTQENWQIYECFTHKIVCDDSAGMLVFFMGASLIILDGFNVLCRHDCIIMFNMGSHDSTT